jgi:cell division protease FtsH
MSSTLRNLVVWVVLGSLMVYVFNNLNSSSARDEISYSEFQREVISDNVQKVTIKGDQQTIVGIRLDGTTFETIQALYKNDELVNNALQENRVTVVNEKPEQPSIFSQ